MVGFVLGTGPSLSSFPGGPGVRVGVNDIWKFHRVDHLVLQNFARQFSPGRQHWIRRARPDVFWSGLDDWAGVPNWRRFDVISPRHSVDFKNLDAFAYSSFSPFSAMDIAVKKCGIDSLEVFGVDLVGHPSLGDPDQLARCIGAIKNFVIDCPVPVLWAASSPLVELLSGVLDVSRVGSLRVLLTRKNN